MEPHPTVQDSDALPSGVFVNNYVHSLDGKKRLTIPSDWREMVGKPEKLFVLPGINEKCLYVFPGREFAQRMERIRKLSIANVKGRQMARTLASRSDLVGWDVQGRIRVKDELLSYAGLVNQVVLVGGFDRFELWSPEDWKLQESAMDDGGLGEAAEFVGF